MIRSRINRAFPALALAICAAASVGAQGLSSGSSSGSIATGKQRPGQPALAAPTTPLTTPQGATPTPSTSPLPGQSTMGSPLPPLNSTGVGGQSALVSPPAGVPTRSSTAAEAFSMLDSAQLGFVTRAQADRIPGFVGFDNADTNRDGQLSREEFAIAWRSFSGQ